MNRLLTISGIPLVLYCLWRNRLANDAGKHRNASIPRQQSGRPPPWSFPYPRSRGTDVSKVSGSFRVFASQAAGWQGIDALLHSGTYFNLSTNDAVATWAPALENAISRQERMYSTGNYSVTATLVITPP